MRLELAWENGCASARRYRGSHSDLLVPVHYKDKDGFALGEWIVYNRQRYLGGNLTQNRIERLEAIGMVWSTSNDLWEQNYAAATQYYLEHGDLEVPIKYETPSGFGLGVWLGASAPLTRQASCHRSRWSGWTLWAWTGPTATTASGCPCTMLPPPTTMSTAT